MASQPGRGRRRSSALTGATNPADIPLTAEEARLQSVIRDINNTNAQQRAKEQSEIEAARAAAAPNSSASYPTVNSAQATSGVASHNTPTDGADTFSISGYQFPGAPDKGKGKERESSVRSHHRRTFSISNIEESHLEALQALGLTQEELRGVCGWESPYPSLSPPQQFSSYHQNLDNRSAFDSYHAAPTLVDPFTSPRGYSGPPQGSPNQTRYLPRSEAPRSSSAPLFGKQPIVRGSHTSQTQYPKVSESPHQTARFERQPISAGSHTSQIQYPTSIEGPRLTTHFTRQPIAAGSRASQTQYSTGRITSRSPDTRYDRGSETHFERSPAPGSESTRSERAHRPEPPLLERSTTRRVSSRASTPIQQPPPTQQNKPIKISHKFIRMNPEFFGGLSGSGTSPRQAPSPQSMNHSNGINGAAALPAMMAGMPTPAGHQSDLNYIQELVDQLSQVLAANQAASRRVVNSLDQVRERAIEKNMSNDDIMNEVSATVNASTLKLEQENAALRKELESARYSEKANMDLCRQFQKRMSTIADEIRMFKYKTTMDMCAWHRSYRNQLAEERQKNLDLNIRILDMQEHAARANEWLRKFQRAWNDDPLYHELKVQNIALRQEKRKWKRMAMPFLPDDDSEFSDDDDMIDPVEKKRLMQIEIDKKMAAKQEKKAAAVAAASAAGNSGPGLIQ